MSLCNLHLQNWAFWIQQSKNKKGVTFEVRRRKQKTETLIGVKENMELPWKRGSGLETYEYPDLQKRETTGQSDQVGFCDLQVLDLSHIPFLLVVFTPGVTGSMWSSSWGENCHLEKEGFEFILSISSRHATLLTETVISLSSYSKQQPYLWLLDHTGPKTKLSFG